MTLADWNARRRALTRLERAGWLNTRVNKLRVWAEYLAPRQCPLVMRYPSLDKLIASIRAYRRKHKFWECI